MTNTPPASDLLTIVTMNTLNMDDEHVERFTAILQEAFNSNVDVLLLQEVIAIYREEIIEVCQAQGYPYYAFASSKEEALANYKSGNLIVSRLPFTSTGSLVFPQDPEILPAATASLEINGHDVHVISTHYFWGGANGHVRLYQSRIINEYANAIKEENPNAIVILGGDLNDEPDTASIRYLMGKHSTEGVPSAFWTDVTTRTEWEHRPTSRPYGQWGVKTAHRVGILDPFQVPERKLDYLFVHGWIFGRYGYPLNPSLFGTGLTENGHEQSDHYGVKSDFWLPKK